MIVCVTFFVIVYKQAYLQEYIANLLKQAFPHLQE